ncbi:hypothetical protein EDD21DRAFT_230303 [Dissophora ornata]|nr:hypothetical protein EDD21DRAFT_230303 [Dissophora ornata]
MTGMQSRKIGSTKPHGKDRKRFIKVHRWRIAIGCGWRMLPDQCHVFCLLHIPLFELESSPLFLFFALASTLAFFILKKMERPAQTLLNFTLVHCDPIPFADILLTITSGSSTEEPSEIYSICSLHFSSLRSHTSEYHSSTCTVHFNSDGVKESPTLSRIDGGFHIPSLL